MCKIISTHELYATKESVIPLHAPGEAPVEEAEVVAASQFWWVYHGQAIDLLELSCQQQCSRRGCSDSASPLEHWDLEFENKNKTRTIEILQTESQCCASIQNKVYIVYRLDRLVFDDSSCALLPVSTPLFLFGDVSFCHSSDWASWSLMLLFPSWLSAPMNRYIWTSLSPLCSSSFKILRWSTKTQHTNKFRQILIYYTFHTVAFGLPESLK